MSDQLGQLLGYFDNDGVTELVIHTGQPIAVRVNGEYRAVTEGTVSKPQLAHLMLGTPLDALSPEDERNSEVRMVDLNGRKMHALLIKRGKEIALTLATSPPLPAPVAYSPQITKPARPTTNTIPPPKPIPPPAVPSPAARPPATPPATPPPRPGTPGIGVRVSTPAPPIGDHTDPSIQLNAMPMANVLDDLPIGPPGLSLDLDPEENEGTNLHAIPRAPAPPASSQRLPRAVSISGDADDGFELESGLPRSVTGTVNIPEMDAETTDSGWVPNLEPAIPRSATQERTQFSPPVAVAPSPQVAPPPQVFAPSVVVVSSAIAPSIARVIPEDGERVSLVDEPIEVSTILVNIVRAARNANASDLHIAANRPLLIRTMGELRALDAKPVTPTEVEAVLLPLLGPMRRKQLEQRGYVDLAVEVPGGGRLRTNISRIQGGLKGAFRLALPRPFTLEELALPKEVAKVVSHHQGLVVIAGPSGHGKTTTLAALVDLVNTNRPHHILTVEDPVEIEHPRKAAVISQREVGRHTRSFAAALKASLREDPDVIVIGELRDRETVEIAMTAAETGHLVLATMSTPSAAKTIDRLIDMFPPDDQSQVRASLAGALRAIVAQRLVPTKDGKITPAIELLTGVLPLAVLIRDNKLFQLPNLMQRGRSLGMIRLDESLIDLVRRGKISEETAMSYADSKKEMTNALRLPATSPIPKLVK